MTPVQILEAVGQEMEATGHAVWFQDGWKTRSVGGAFEPAGLVCHHTGTNRHAAGDYPSLGIVRDGVDQGGGYFLPGPLAQLGLGRSGTVYVIAAGKCLERGTTVLTRRGVVPIETVAVGDEVWTHRERWQPVEAVHHSRREAVRVSGVGHPGLLCSPEHRWFVHSGWQGSDGVKRWTPGPLHPIQSRDMDGSLWASPTRFGDAQPPSVDGFVVTPELMKVVGAWVADGTMGTDWQPKITPRSSKAEIVCGWLDAAGLRWHRRSDADGTARLGIGSAALGRWLQEHFGRGSTQRTVPAWLLGTDPKFGEAFLEGYLHGDGHWRAPAGSRSGVWMGSTASRCLAFGLRLLAGRLGWYAIVTRRAWAAETVIKGRVCRPTAETWFIQLRPERPRTARSWLVQDRWVSRVSVADGEVADMVDLTVAVDHSFVADGIFSHNSNHAGPGGWDGLSGNFSVWGIEAENDGIGEPWPPEQVEAYLALAAALARHTGFDAARVCRHAEWSTAGKIDPATAPMNDGDWIRSQVAARLRSQPQPSQEDDEMFTYSTAPDVDGGSIWFVVNGVAHRLHLPADADRINKAGVLSLGEMSEAFHGVFDHRG